MAEPTSDETRDDAPAPSASATKLATFGAGCFWCVEAVFEELEGVLSVESGYSNGHVDDPTYEQVCSGLTGHAEVARIRYDPKRVNRQGADVGTQYRSGVYFHDEEQQRIAEELKAKLDASGAFPAPIVTEIVPVKRYYPAEDGHQDYYAQNPNEGYCRVVIAPKLEKFRKAFAGHLKQTR